MLSEQQADIGGLALNYAEGPKTGPPFVLLHGGSARWQYGERFLGSLADRWHVYAPDLRGHGRSDRAPGRYRLVDYGADIAAFLERVVGAPAVLYGHSLGGEVAVVAAARTSVPLRGVIIGDSPLSPTDSPTQAPAHQAMIAAWRALAASGASPTEMARALQALPVEQPGSETPVPAADALGEDNHWFAFMGQSLADLDPETLAFVQQPDRMFDGYDMETTLAAIPCPVLLLQADPAAGQVLDDAVAARALRYLRRGSRTRLDGIGHPLHGTHPDPVRAAIEAFLAAI